MLHSLPLSFTEEAGKSKDSQSPFEYGHIPLRGLEYRKSLKKGDMVLINIETMIGGEYGKVLRNDGERVKVQISGYRKNGRPLYRSFWIKNGLSCGPATTNRGWGYNWLFYHIVTPFSFGVKIRRIIDLDPADIEILSTQIVEPAEDIPF